MTCPVAIQKLLKNNKILYWPRKEADKNVALEFISAQIPPEIRLAEKEINQIISQNILFEDYALVRRELIERGFVYRTNDCREYWRLTSQNDQALPVL